MSACLSILEIIMSCPNQPHGILQGWHWDEWLPSQDSYFGTQVVSFHQIFHIYLVIFRILNPQPILILNSKSYCNTHMTFVPGCHPWRERTQWNVSPRDRTFFSHTNFRYCYKVIVFHLMFTLLYFLIMAYQAIIIYIMERCFPSFHMSLWKDAWSF